jgi:hypothetical protein
MKVGVGQLRSFVAYKGTADTCIEIVEEYVRLPDVPIALDGMLQISF